MNGDKVWLCEGTRGNRSGDTPLAALDNYALCHGRRGTLRLYAAARCADGMVAHTFGMPSVRGTFRDLQGWAAAQMVKP